MSEYNDKLKNEIASFREVGQRFVNKEITANEFKGKSGGMGVYAQRGGEKFMIRLRIPSGVLSFTHLNFITELVKQYGLKHIHLTTRQAIQLHDLDFGQICDIMEESINHGLYTRGGGGNFPRNIALSPLSGVEINEAFDVTPYALLAGNYIMEKMTEYHLPRKLKIAFSNNEKDSANCTINDLGFIAVRKDGKPYFKVFIAGGLGNNPAIALHYDELVPPEEVLYHVEAVTRIFVSEGDYENKGKARLRYVPRRMGEEAFLKAYKEHLSEVKSTMGLVEITPVLSEDAEIDINYKAIEELIPQKQKGLYSVNIHPLCGQMPLDALCKLVSFLENLKDVDIRLTMTESMYIRNLSLDKAKELLDLMNDVRQKTKVEMSVSCVGVPTCQIGVEQSQELCKEILYALNNKNINSDYLPSIHISGCNNSCARHQVNVMGFAGGKKRIGSQVYDVFELHVGGCFSMDKTEFGKKLGFLKKEDIPTFIVELALELEGRKKDFNEYISEDFDKFEVLVKPYIHD